MNNEIIGGKATSVSVSATKAKNELGSLLEQTIAGQTVIITKRDVPKAVLISVQTYNALIGAQRATLDTLAREYDTLLAKMQTAPARSAMAAAFAASPDELGQAAVETKRRHK